MKRRDFLQRLSAFGVALLAPIESIPEEITPEIAAELVPTLKMSDLDDILYEYYHPHISEMMTRKSVILTLMEEKKVPKSGKVRISFGKNSKEIDLDEDR